MSKEKDKKGTPAKVETDVKQTTYRCGKKHSNGSSSDKKNSGIGVENE